MTQFFVTGTDTNVGKTVASAWLMLHTGARYWKPVQSGLDAPTDAQTIKALTGFDDDYFFPSIYSLRAPLSPHEAARRDGVTIDLKNIHLPRTSNPLIVEGAGGLMVPMNDNEMMIDLIQQLTLPVILVCRSTLGTINHTLLSLHALRHRNIPVAGMIISGPRMPHNREALEKFGHAPVLGEIDFLEHLTKEALQSVAPEPCLADQISSSQISSPAFARLPQVG